MTGTIRSTLGVLIAAVITAEACFANGACALSLDRGSLDVIGWMTF